MTKFAIIVAMDEALGIGKNETLAWHLSADLKQFKALTSGHTVIMGRKTWDSLPLKSKPLPNRLNIVISRQKLDLGQGVLLASNLDEALKQATTSQVFVIGGAQIYTQAILHPDCEKIFVTHVSGNFACDASFPPIPPQFKAVANSPQMIEGTVSFQFVEYKRA